MIQTSKHKPPWSPLEDMLGVKKRKDLNIYLYFCVTKFAEG